MIILGFLMIAALAISIFLAWYARNVIKKLQYTFESIETLDLGLQSFENHLKYIYELEMYYGDETLEKLIAHAKDVTNSFSEFRKDYEIYNGEIDEKEFFEEEENNAAEEKNARQDLLLERS